MLLEEIKNYEKLPPEWTQLDPSGIKYPEAFSPRLQQDQISSTVGPESDTNHYDSDTHKDSHHVHEHEHGHAHGEEPHHAHGHEHDHHHDKKPIISRRWKWATVLGNAAIGVAEIVAGNTTTLSATTDGIHNGADALTYNMQANNILHTGMSEAKRQKMRKLSHWIISATSAGLMVKAGVDLGIDHEGTPHASTIYAASASLALNGILYTRLRRGQKQRVGPATDHEHDISKHFLAIDIPSAALAVAGTALQKYNVNIEQAAAIVSGAIGAYAFRPTKANLSHNCLGHALDGAPHDHAHHDHGHDHSHHVHEHGQHPSRLSRLKKALGERASTAAMRVSIALGPRVTHAKRQLADSSYEASLMPQRTITVPA